MPMWIGADGRSLYWRLLSTRTAMPSQMLSKSSRRWSLLCEVIINREDTSMYYGMVRNIDQLAEPLDSDAHTEESLVVVANSRVRRLP